MNQEIIWFLKNHLSKTHPVYIITTCLYYLIYKGHLWGLTGLINTGIISKRKTYSQELSRFFSPTWVNCQFLESIQKVCRTQIEVEECTFLEGRLSSYPETKNSQMPCNPLWIWAIQLITACSGKSSWGRNRPKTREPLPVHTFPYKERKESTKERKMFANGPVTVMSCSTSLIHACKNK